MIHRQLATSQCFSWCQNNEVNKVKILCIGITSTFMGTFITRKPNGMWRTERKSHISCRKALWIVTVPLYQLVIIERNETGDKISVMLLFTLKNIIDVLTEKHHRWFGAFIFGKKCSVHVSVRYSGKSSLNLMSHTLSDRKLTWCWHQW